LVTLQKKKKKPRGPIPPPHGKARRRGRPKSVNLTGWTREYAIYQTMKSFRSRRASHSEGIKTALFSTLRASRIKKHQSQKEEKKRRYYNYPDWQIGAKGVEVGRTAFGDGEKKKNDGKKKKKSKAKRRLGEGQPTSQKREKSFQSRMRRPKPQTRKSHQKLGGGGDRRRRGGRPPSKRANIIKKKREGRRNSGCFISVRPWTLAPRGGEGRISVR